MLTFLGMDKGKLKVEMASGAKRLLNPNVGHISFGYVTTSHAAQGRTVERVLIDPPLRHSVRWTSPPGTWRSAAAGRVRKFSPTARPNCWKR